MIFDFLRPFYFQTKALMYVFLMATLRYNQRQFHCSQLYCGQCMWVSELAGMNHGIHELVSPKSFSSIKQQF